MPTPMSLNTTSQSPASALSLSLLCHRPESLPLSGLSFPGSNRPSLVLDVTIRSPKALRSEDLWLERRRRGREQYLERGLNLQQGPQADLRGRLVSLELWSASAEQEGGQAQTSCMADHSGEGASLA